jgi:inorganic pyrophosphatase
MAIKDLPFGTMQEFNVVVEIPKGSQDKYEYDEKLDVVKLDRVLYGSQRFPFNYGFIPETRALDGDHADAVLLSTNPINSGIVVEARAIGFMEMIDGGEVDNKIICVPTKDPRFLDIINMDDLPAHTQKEMQNFFETYKLLEKKTVEIKGFEGLDRAQQELESTLAAYKNEHKS